MTKLKVPLLSLGAHGSIGDTITVQKKGDSHFSRRKPYPFNPRSLAQTYHRWDYEDYSQLWHTLTPTEKQQWESDARRLHITGYNYWLRQKLTTLPDIAGRWHLDEPAGSKAHDTSKQANHGTYFGSITTPGLISQARYFDGIDDRVLIPHSPSLDITGALSVELFLKTTTNAQGIVSKGHGAPNRGWYFFILNTNILRFRVQMASGAWLDTETTSIVTDDLWHHVTGVFKPSSYVRIFLDSTKEDEKTVGVEASMKSNTHDVYLGRTQLEYYADMDLDEVVIRTRVLEQPEIERHSKRRHA